MGIQAAKEQREREKREGRKEFYCLFFTDPSRRDTIGKERER
jgi:hypothetical protein